MSTYTDHSMTNHHNHVLAHPGDAFAELLQLWRQRYARRRELAQLTEADFHDVGASWSDFAHEADKPFWRN
jgi:uncharacterized protein YjiS (DUF1127 family)